MLTQARFHTCFCVQPHFRVLTLDGGGVRGLIEIEVLILLEAAIKQVDPNATIDSTFDAIYGTSTGYSL